MAEAKERYRANGWTVKNVSDTSCYDLNCTRPSGDELHVEVKGTQSEGVQILLTKNEVLHARALFPRVALFILSGVEVRDTDTEQPVCSGGIVSVLEPWLLDEDSLVPLSYQYRTR